MPEGHLVHRHARELAERLAGGPISASSPQGRFAEGAAAIDGTALTSTEAYGKHLFVSFDGVRRLLHVHLGRQGLWLWGTPETAPRPSVRLRLASTTTAADVIAPIICEIGASDLRTAVVTGLGPDPLRADADPDAVRRAIRSSSRPIGALLLEQAVVSGLGNVLRAEILNLVGIHPSTPGAALDNEAFDAIWTRTVEVMRRAELEGRIITRRRDGSTIGEVDDIEGRYVYGRETCGRCGTDLESLTVGGRAINACPYCQPRASA